MTKFVRAALPMAVVLAASLLVGCEKSEPVSEEESNALIAPVARVEVAGAAPQATAALLSGDQVVQQFCAACHTPGAAGAPKTGDKAAWAPRIAQGYEALLAAAIKGKGAMPPKGGAATLQDIEVARAVVVLANQAGANFPAPAAPAAPPPMPAAADASAPVAAAAATAATVQTASAADGKKVHDTACMACHMTGAANAPKTGDKAAWTARLAQGMPALYASALNGKGAMPAKGGNPSLPEGDVKAAVDYMVAQSK